MDHSPKFLIDPSEALALADSAAITLPELLPRLVPAAQSLARPPISNFPVAAVGLGPSGRIFVGVNLEFPGLPLHHSVHAEQFLLCKLKNAALDAANKSHAPYTASPSGVALLDRQGNLYKGSYLESAAFNPSLGPVQAALVAFVAAGGGDYHQIVDAVLVEKEDAAVKQEHTARLLLHSISPDCNFSTFLCHSEPSPP